MNQAIFNMGLSTEATSLFILLEHLSDSGAVLSKESALPLWNADPEQMEGAARELISRHMLGLDTGNRWFIKPQSEWE